MSRPAPAAMLMAVGLALLTTRADAGMIDESALDPWEACALCHSLDGISRMAKFPKLAGQPAGYIAKQLADFRTGRRDNDGGQMQAMAGDLLAEGVVAVAGYFSSLPPPPPVETVRDAAAAALVNTGDPAREVPACLSCHGADRIADSGAPRLEAQHPDYLAKQLADFRSERRRNDVGGRMRQIALQLTDAEISALVAYLGGLERN